MKEVIKQNSRREHLNPAKIKASIESAAREAGYSEKDAEHVINRVLPPVLGIMLDREEVKTAEIRDAVLRELDDRYPKVSAVWRNYNKVKASK
jgi:transcriptional regulator NrdR family protein